MFFHETVSVGGSVLLETVDVRSISDDTPCQLVLFDRESELTRLSSNQPPRVLTIDSTLKAALAILQLILSAIMGWVLITVIDHGDRISRSEVKMQYQIDGSVELIKTISVMNDRLSQIIATQIQMSSEMTSLKVDIQRLNDKK